MSIIDTRLLKPNTRLLLETEKAVYEIELTNPKTGEINIQGGRFLVWIEAKLNGSFGESLNKTGEKVLREGIIDFADSVDITYKKDGFVHNLSTAPVLSCQISYNDEEQEKSWHYEMWGDYDISESLLEARRRCVSGGQE